MARLARLDLPGIPQHIAQRGNNRLPCFLDDGNRMRYLHLLGDALRASGCQPHAYVLMDNHVHLLATPAEAGAVGRMMQRLGRGYIGLFNGRHGRTGTMWEGRYKACLVDSEDHVLRCYRYIDLNPVRARITHGPASYRWSSCAANLGERQHSGLTAHPAWQSLGSSRQERGTAYRALLDEVLDHDALAEMRIYLQKRRALGKTPSAPWSKPTPLKGGDVDSTRFPVSGPHRPKSRAAHPEN